MRVFLLALALLATTPALADPARDAYYRDVRRETERSYRQHRDTIDPGGLRGKGHDLDHITPRGQGYRQGTAPSEMGAPGNLRMLPSGQNRSEGCRGACR